LIEFFFVFLSKASNGGESFWQIFAKHILAN
jgi:hypothetical protein